MASNTRRADTRPCAVWTVTPEAVRLQRRGQGVLVNPHAETLAGRGQTPGQSGRIQDRGAAGIVQPGQVGRRGDLCTYPLGVHQLQFAPEPGRRLILLGETLGLPRRDRHGQLAVALEVAGNAVPGDGRLDRVECLVTHPQQGGQLIGVPIGAVGQSVGDAGRAESAVAAGRPFGDPVPLEQHDAAAGVGLDGLERGPQSGEAATHHEQIGFGVSDEPAAGGRPLGSVQPVRRRYRISKRSGRIHFPTLVFRGAGEPASTVPGARTSPAQEWRAARPSRSAGSRPRTDRSASGRRSAGPSGAVG